MKEEVKESLAEPQSAFHQQMLTDSLALVDMSRRRMTEFYENWDANDDTYRGYRDRDTDDKHASKRKEPEKMVVPIAYSQIQTFVAFCMSLYTQRERFFELIGVSEPDHASAKIGEALLQRDLIYNRFEHRLYQFLLDVSRFGLGILKTTWVHEQQRTIKETPIPSAFGGLGTVLKVPTIETKYLGNKICNVSPYRFFPDVRYPLHRFQEGEFIASEDEYSWVSLKQMEKEGTVTGIDMVKPLTRERLRERGETRFTQLDGGETVNAMPLRGGGQSKGTVIVTELQRIIIPSHYKIDGEPLGNEDYPVKYVIWYANDNRIIKCEPLETGHDLFTYDLGQYNPDQHHLVNQGLSSSIDNLQAVVSWFINSRITNVRKVIQNHLVVDPQYVEMKDVNARSPVIRLRSEVAGRDWQRAIGQLPIQDVTSAHVADAQYLVKMIEVTTGISENLMGQFHGGRRSATEARNVSSSAAARLKVIASQIFNSALEPMGRKMLSNLRKGLDEETIVRTVGLEPAMKGAKFTKVSKTDLTGNYDFEVFGGTLPSEKGVTAQALQDLLVALLRVPQAAVALGIDPKAVLMEQLELRGVRNPERFTLKVPEQGAALQDQMNQAGLLGTKPQGGNGNGKPTQPPPATEAEPGPTGFGRLVSS